MTLRLPEPKIRKRAVRAVQKHRDKSQYTRRKKHKAIGFPPVALCFDWPVPAYPAQLGAGKRTPDPAARAYLKVIEKAPDVVTEALSGHPA